MPMLLHLLELPLLFREFSEPFSKELVFFFFFYFNQSDNEGYLFFSKLKKVHPLGVCWAVLFSKTTAVQCSSGLLGSTPSFTVLSTVWFISSWTTCGQSPPVKVLSSSD